MSWFQEAIAVTRIYLDTRADELCRVAGMNRKTCELAVPYHCARLWVLAGASHQDGRLWARYRLCVTLLLKPKAKKKKQWKEFSEICLHPIHLEFTKLCTNLRPRCDTEAAVGTDLGLLLLGVSHLRPLLFGSFGSCKNRRDYQHIFHEYANITFLPYL